MHALYDLIAYPEYVEPLRQEIETLVSAEGWKYSTLAKMEKLDSFLKESIRCHPISSGSIHMISF
jgi:Cytochrome P450